MTAADVRGKSFYLESITYQNASAVAISRTPPDDLKTDAYYAGHSVPTVFGIIVYPHVEFTDRGVLITGVEWPNMMWAGLARKAYRECEPLTLPPDQIWDPDADGAVAAPNRLDDCKRQRVYLSVSEFRKYTPAKLKVG